MLDSMIDFYQTFVEQVEHGLSSSFHIWLCSQNSLQGADNLLSQAELYTKPLAQLINIHLSFRWWSSSPHTWHGHSPDISSHRSQSWSWSHGPRLMLNVNVLCTCQTCKVKSTPFLSSQNDQSTGEIKVIGGDDLSTLTGKVRSL